MRKNRIFLSVIVLTGLIFLTLERRQTFAEAQQKEYTTVDIQRLQIDLQLSDVLRKIPFDVKKLEIESKKQISSYTSFSQIIQNEIEEVFKMEGYHGVRPVKWKDEPNRRLEFNIDVLQIPDQNNYVYSVDVSYKEKVSLYSIEDINKINANIWWGKTDLSVASKEELYNKILKEVKHFAKALVADYADHIATEIHK
ncbi:MAG: hypothetical protein JW787_13380 [Sedimentisphaerales bacterium]|nr:hypothetical protein [Sedimentisphaerales bacterium]